MRHSARPSRRAAVAGLLLLGAVLPTVGSAQAGSGGDRASQAGEGDVVVRRDTRHDTSAPLRVLIQRFARETGSRMGGDAEAAGTAQPTRTIPRPTASRPEADGALQTERFEPNVPSTTMEFEGIANADQPENPIPPDTNGEAGISQYVQMVNFSMAVYDKDTGAEELAPFHTNAIWQGFGGVCQTTNQGDPIVLYDQIADRWLISQFAFNLDGQGDPNGPYFECIAVSQTADATGEWHRYQFLIDNTELNDYPKLGVWPDAYYMGVNEFDQNENFEYSGVKVVAFERDQMLIGGVARTIIRQRGSATSAIQPFTLLPSDLDGDTLPPPDSPNYFVEMDAGEFGPGHGDRLKVYEFDVDWTTPTNSSFTGPALAPAVPFDPNLCGFGDCVPQPGGPRLDSLAGRLMFRNAYRNFGTHESIVVNHSVDTGGNRAGVRWYELRSPGTGPFIHQQGTFAPGSLHRWMGSAAMDQDGNLAVGYSASSSSVHPSIRYAGRLATDPPNQLAQGENTLQHGMGSQTAPAARWGDYTDMTIDPVDDCTFWYTNQYYSSTSGREWKTRIGSFKYPSCGPGDPGPTVSIENEQSQEGNDLVFTVRLSEGVPGAEVEVDYATAHGTARAADYVAQSDTLTFPPNETQMDIVIESTEDTALESDEFFFVELTGSTPNVTIDDGQAEGRINNDDVACPGREGQAGNHIVGTGAGETLTGTGGRDIICGLGGNDRLEGIGGNDVLIGGLGADTLLGGVGADLLTGGDGADTLLGGDGADRLESDAGRDFLAGQNGIDVVVAGLGNDEGHGGPGNDNLLGQKGSDALFGEGGNDRFNGGAGTDRCVQGPGSGARVACERFS